MQYALTAAAFAAVAMAMPQAKTPPQPASSECKATYPGSFQIQVVNVTSSGNTKRQTFGQQDAQGTLTLTLNNGVLKDTLDRTGEIVANNQFQFDKPLQPDAKITSGWAACPNGTLVLGSDAIFKQCLSGDFYNLYDENGAGQCNEIYIQIINGGSSASAAPSAASSAASVTQITDGQAQAATSAAPVSQISDGQPQAATSGAPVTQIGDGQPQAATSGAPVTQIGDGQIQAATSTGAPVTQIGDGQIQAATSGAPVTQINDGQIQASTGAAPVTQINDGQIQAPTGSPVTQISDGQIQAPTGSPVTQISDGQIQAPTGAPVTQIGDGQIQAPTNGTASRPTPSVQAYTGAAAIPTAIGSAFGLAIGAVAVAML